MNRFSCLLLLAALFVSSCATQRSKPSRIEQGEVTFIIMDVHHREIDHVRPLWSAAWMALAGSMIGSGATANGIGAGGGALVGAGLSYLNQAREARQVHRVIDVQSDISGITYRIHSKDPQPFQLGQKVWLTFDRHGVADRVLPRVPGMVPAVP